MGFTTVFPRPSKPIKGGSRNSGAAKGSPASERDRHEEGARSLARWGFSRVLPGLKDVPGEAAVGAWGSRWQWRTRRDLRDPAVCRSRGTQRAGELRLASTALPSWPSGESSHRRRPWGRGAPPTRPRPFPSSSCAPPPAAPPRLPARVPVPAGPRFPFPAPCALCCPLFQRLKILKLYFGHVGHVTHRADDS